MDPIPNPQVKPICVLDMSSLGKEISAYEVCVASGFGEIQNVGNNENSEDFPKKMKCLSQYTCKLSKKIHICASFIILN